MSEKHQYFETLNTNAAIEAAMIENPAIVYFFHGSGSSGFQLQDWLKNLCKKTFSFPHIKVVFLSAPYQNYQINVDREFRIWFDREALTESSDEKKESVNQMCSKILSIIEEEVDKGTPYEKIVVGGFSMGGALALHLAYRFNKPFAGCFAISSFLNHDSQVYESLDANTESEKPPLLAMHGVRDCLILKEWSNKLLTNLSAKGVKVSHRVFDKDHEIIKAEVENLHRWLLKLFPHEELKENL